MNEQNEQSESPSSLYRKNIIEAMEDQDNLKIRRIAKLITKAAGQREISHVSAVDLLSLAIDCMILWEKNNPPVIPANASRLADFSVQSQGLYEGKERN